MYNNNVLIDDYYYWLLDLIDEPEHPVKLYSKVLEKLFHREFYDLVANDDNRIQDGFDLRIQFSDYVGEHLYFVMDELPDYCSVLEMMIALARRWENEVTFDPDDYDHSSEWFWLMMSNLGLDQATDDCYDESKVDEILYIFLERKYDRDGKGGLFHILDSKVDMRKQEIWYQINYYFSEYWNLRQ